MLLLICVGVLCITCGVTSGTGVTEVDIYRVLAERSVPYDTNAVHAAAVEALLHAIDPGARIIVSEPLVLPDPVCIEQAEEWAYGIGYLKLAGLHEGCVADVTDQVREWLKAGRTRLVVDLRGATGTANSAVDRIAGAFVEKGRPLYVLRDGAGEVAERHLSPGDGRRAVPTQLMLLVDGSTTGACELLAAVMQGRQGVLVLGELTAGDAGIREKVDLPDGTSLWLATQWAEPGDGTGTVYHGTGVTPDIMLSVPAEEQAAPIVPAEGRPGRPLSPKAGMDRELMKRVSGDVLMGRATDVLLSLRALEANRGQGPDSVAPDGDSHAE